MRASDPATVNCLYSVWAHGGHVVLEMSALTRVKYGNCLYSVWAHGRHVVLEMVGVTRKSKTSLSHSHLPAVDLAHSTST